MTFSSPSQFEPELNWAGKFCRGLMGVVGVGLLSATIAAFFPVSLMATCHQWLGLGVFPDAPITIYLARSASLLYALHGAVMVHVAWHFRRCQPMVPLIGWLHVVLGISMLAVDVNAGMPGYWTAGEGAPIALTGACILWLFHRSSSKEEAKSTRADDHHE